MKTTVTGLAQAGGLPMPNNNVAAQSGLMGMSNPTPQLQVGATNSPTATIATLPMQVNSTAGAPPTGLIGYEDALTTGLNAGAGVLSAGAGDAVGTLSNAVNSVGGPVSYAPGQTGVNAAIGQGVDALSAYNTHGQNAAQHRADLSGANGLEAAQAAQQQFTNSPGYQYMMDEMQRATERSAAAQGGLMGGNVMKELQRNAMGLAAQDYDNYFNRLSGVADSGLQAGNSIGQLRGQQAGYQNQANIAKQQSLTQQKMAQDQIKAQLQKEMANTLFQTGLTGAQMMTQTGGLMADGRWNAGQAISNNVNSATSQLANLVNQQGGQLSDYMNQDLGTLTNMVYQSGMQDRVDNQQLAAILANIAGGQASQVNTNYQNIGGFNAAATQAAGNSFNDWMEQMIASGALS